MSYAEPLEESAHCREGPHQGQVGRFEELRPVLFNIGAFRGEQVGRHKAGHQLIRALADVRANVVEVRLHAEMTEGFTPGMGMQVDAVDQRPIHVEDHGGHRALRSASGF